MFSKNAMVTSIAVGAVVTFTLTSNHGYTSGTSLIVKLGDTILFQSEKIVKGETISGKMFLPIEEALTFTSIGPELPGVPSTQISSELYVQITL